MKRITDTHFVPALGKEHIQLSDNIRWPVFIAGMSVASKTYQLFAGLFLLTL